MWSLAVGKPGLSRRSRNWGFRRTADHDLVIGPSRLRFFVRKGATLQLAAPPDADALCAVGMIPKAIFKK